MRKIGALILALIFSCGCSKKLEISTSAEVWGVVKFAAVRRPFYSREYVLELEMWYSKDLHNFMWVKESEEGRVTCVLDGRANIEARNVKVEVNEMVEEVVVLFKREDLNIWVCNPASFNKVLVQVPTQKDADAWKKVLSKSRTKKVVVPVEVNY